MNDETNIELPQALIDRLKAQDHSVAMLTAQADRNIAAAARAQFARPQVNSAGTGAVVDVRTQSANAHRKDIHDSARALRKNARFRRIPASWGLAAAAAAAMVFVVVTLRSPALPGDYDGSGSVDVLDAFALSRELAQNPQFAANDTVDSLMQRIVALDGGVQ